MYKEFDKIIGYTEIKEDLQRSCDIVKNFEKYQKLGVKFPGGILLKGEPGVGKSMMANCFIEATGLQAFVCRKNKPDGQFVDEIKRIFDDAVKNAPSIVLLDDMDKFANEDQYHINAEEYVTVQACIDETKGKRVFVIATVNDIERIPESLLRVGRFDEIIRVNPPSGENAVKIVEHFLNQVSVVENVRADVVTNLLDGNSCALLETVINKAGMNAGFYGKEKIEMEDIIQAFLEVKYSVRREKTKHSKEVEFVGAHEAGHAVVTELLMPETVNLIVLKNVNARWGANGFVSRAEDKADLDPYIKSEYAIMIALAGKAATEVMFDSVDMGCNRDLHRAFDGVAKLVDDVCAYGFDSFVRDDSGQELAGKKDYQISKLMQEYYARVVKLLEKNKTFLTIMTRELVEKRVLVRADIDRIKKEVGTCYV